MGVCFSTREAAVGLATIHLRMNEFKKATEIVGRYLLDGGKELSTSETQKLSEEVKRLIGRVSDSYLREIAGIAIESPALLGVCEGAIAARTSEYPFDNVDALEKKSSLLRIFGMQEKAKELSMLAVNILVGQADADPWKFYKEYLRAARIAAIAEEHEKMDECVFKFLAVCEERGEKEKNLFIYVEGVDAALEFSIVNTAEKLGEKAFYAFLSYGGYAEALELAVKMGKRDLAAIADGMLKRLD